MPNVGEDADQPAEEDEGTAAVDVGQGDDEEVGIAEDDGSDAKEEVDLGDGLLKLDGEDLGKWGDGEGRENGNEDKDELVENDNRLPFVGPVLEIGADQYVYTRYSVKRWRQWRQSLTSGSSALLVGCGIRTSF